MISFVNRNIDKAYEFHKIEISDLFNKIIGDEFIFRGNPKVKVKLPICFLKFLTANIDNLISGKPEELIKINLEYNKLSLTNNDKELVNSFFLQTGYGNFKNIKFLNKLDIDTCSYCNKNYTLNITKNNARAQLDHWFPKDKFPVLALSFHNLIPSCQSCNHLKGNGDKIVKEILENKNATNSEIQKWWEEEALKILNHPYIKSTDFKFTWFFDGDLNKTKVEFRVKGNSTCETTLKFNKTKEIYNAHSNKELKELLDLRYKYSDNYIDILINKTFKGIIMSKEEIYRMVFGIETNEENYHKRPFSKFKHDIIEELKNIK